MTSSALSHNLLDPQGPLNPLRSLAVVVPVRSLSLDLLLNDGINDVTVTATDMIAWKIGDTKSRP